MSAEYGKFCCLFSMLSAENSLAGQIGRLQTGHRGCVKPRSYIRMISMLPERVAQILKPSSTAG